MILNVVKVESRGSMRLCQELVGSKETIGNPRAMGDLEREMTSAMLRVSVKLYHEPIVLALQRARRSSGTEYKASISKLFKASVNLSRSHALVFEIKREQQRLECVGSIYADEVSETLGAGSGGGGTNERQR